MWVIELKMFRVEVFELRYYFDVNTVLFLVMRMVVCWWRGWVFCRGEGAVIRWTLVR